MTDTFEQIISIKSDLQNNIRELFQKLLVDDARLDV